jgi:hypothetical protein
MSTEEIPFTIGGLLHHDPKATLLAGAPDTRWRIQWMNEPMGGPFGGGRKPYALSEDGVLVTAVTDAGFEIECDRDEYSIKQYGFSPKWHRFITWDDLVRACALPAVTADEKAGDAA